MENSDEDDGRGILLDSGKFMSRPSSGGRSAHAGDELYFTGYDMGRARSSENSPYDENGRADYYGYSDAEEQYEYDRQRYAVYLASLRREESLVQSAEEKMRKAKARGRSNVNLSPDEIDALERKRAQEQAIARPVTKGKTSRSTSAVNLTNEKSRKKGGRLFSAPAPARNRQSKSPKTSRKPSLEATVSAPPAFMGHGSGGQPLYSPYTYPFPQDGLRPSSQSSRDTSRSASANNKRQLTPPYDYPYPGYAPYQHRYYPMPDEPRQPSSSRRSPDELFVPRHRAATSAHRPDDLHLPPMPSPQGRRTVTGPPDVSYSKLRHVAPRSPLAEQPPIPRADRPPDRRASTPNPEESSSSESSEDDEQGVRVDIVPEVKGDGYRIERVPVGSNDRERRRRSKR